jgi:hypothetical protein
MKIVSLADITRIYAFDKRDSDTMRRAVKSKHYRKTAG